VTIRSQAQRETGTENSRYLGTPVITAHGTNGRPKARVLLVDDEPTFLQIATLFLETHHRSEIDVVGTARSGEECLARAQLLVPEVILIDLSMPGLSGLRTIPLLRIMFPEMRIIALTLNDDETSRRAVLAAGGEDLISKATMNTDLVPAIRRAMEQDPLKLDFVQL
jgi:DNA-binding NarL/FixJ family response regulator